MRKLLTFLLKFFKRILKRKMTQAEQDFSNHLMGHVFSQIQGTTFISQNKVLNNQNNLDHLTIEVYIYNHFQFIFTLKVVNNGYKDEIKTQIRLLQNKNQNTSNLLIDTETFKKTLDIFLYYLTIHEVRLINLYSLI